MMSMLRQRLTHLVPVLLGVSIISFLLIKITPGDPVRIMVGARASAEAIEAARERYGLDQPLVQQYFNYVGRILHGDFGESIRYQQPVTELMADSLPPTLFLALFALAITLPVTIVLAIAAARSRDSWIDHGIRVTSVLGMTIPVFWLAILLLRVFAVDLGWFPVSGYGTGFAEHLRHLFLPALSLSIWMIPVLFRNLRASIIEKTETDYVLAARSKGLPEGYIFRRHVLRNAALPTLQLLGILVVYLIGGSVVVETVYAIPGLGQMMLNAILGRDYLVVQGLALFYALVTVSVSLLVDILSMLLDPRLRQ